MGRLLLFAFLSMSFLSVNLPYSQLPDYGHKPVANPDVYTVVEGSLSVGAPGILENDENLERKNIEVVIHESARSGTLEVRNDGSFIYQPKDGFQGEDSFRYYLEDGSFRSKKVDVVLLVRPEAGPEVAWVQPGNTGDVIFVGQQDEIELEVSTTNPDSTLRVLFYRWDAVNEEYITIGEASDTPYRTSLNASELNPGFNQVFADIYDQFETRSDIEYLWVYKFAYRSYLPIVGN